MVTLENLAVESAGTKVISATCEYNPKEYILSESLKEFWPTTGMYPQEFIVAFCGPKQIKRVIVSSRKVAEMALYREENNEFVLVQELIIDEQENNLQASVFESVQVYETKKLKVCINKGHESFSSIHRLVAYGEN